MNDNPNASKDELMVAWKMLREHKAQLAKKLLQASLI
jgi:hypothetical protein